jgi:peptide/nickel transport system permease protein
VTVAILDNLWPSAGWRQFRRNRLALLGLALLAAMAALALGAPALPLADPHATDLNQRMLAAGTQGHPLGTDQLGHDFLSRLVWGTRTSLAVGLLAVLIAALLGTLVGLVAGYHRGWLDSVLMRSIDVLLAFPYLLLALAIVAALGPGLRNAMIAIAVVNVPFFARTVRGTVLGLAGREFIDAARLIGAGPGRILFRELLPNVLPVVVIMISTNLGWMILETAGLSFLGLGAQPPTADLGSMLGTGREFLTTAPRVAILPGVVILLLVVGINLVGDGLRDALDPRLKGESGSKPAPPAVDQLATAPRPPADALLRVENLSTHFQHAAETHRAVDEMTFDLGAGERLAVVGESGSGKSITALSLLGLVPHPGRIPGGRILFEGEDLLRVTEERRRQLRGGRIAYIPQNPMTALNPVLTVGAQIVETLYAHRHIARHEARRRAVELLERLRIAEPSERLKAYPHELSGGMRQRAVIAMALANDPALIIADEATTALDVTVQAEILKLMDALCEARDAALLFISHDLGVVTHLCNRALVMYAGRVVEEGNIETLLYRPAHPYTRALLACAPELGRPGKSLTPIRGHPPPLNDLPDGCHFAPRCDFAQDKCRNNSIGLRTFGTERRVRCIRAEELEPWQR